VRGFCHATCAKHRLRKIVAENPLPTGERRNESEPNSPF
jgi:hypothetical protein